MSKVAHAPEASEPRGGWVLTHTKVKMYPLDPNWRMINLQDIAHALSNTCRFSGQCKRFYSVAEHCLHVSMHVPRNMAAIALLHDASEAYLTDVPRPIKGHFYLALSEREGGLPYRHYEDQMLRVIMESLLGAPWDTFIGGLPVEVRKADDRMLTTEYLDMMNGELTAALSQFKPYAGYRFGYFTPEDVKQQFLNRARQLKIAPVGKPLPAPRTLG